MCRWNTGEKWSDRHCFLAFDAHLCSCWDAVLQTMHRDLVTPAWIWRWFTLGGHVEGRTFNLVGRVVELIPLLPVYTRSSNASLFSLSRRSSISYIYLLSPHTHSHSWVNTHTLHLCRLRKTVCVCVCIQHWSFVHRVLRQMSLSPKMEIFLNKGTVDDIFQHNQISLKQNRARLYTLRYVQTRTRKLKMIMYEWVITLFYACQHKHICKWR